MPSEKSATIWRIETEGGTGMYSWGAYEKVFCEDIPDSTNGDKHPGPYSDSQLGWTKIHPLDRDRYVFGFASLAQMRQWVYMPKWRRTLANSGLVLRKYSVPAEFFRRSPFQAVFVRDMGVVVEERRPDYAD